MPGLIDVYASMPWYMEHLQPIVDALGPDIGHVYQGPVMPRVRDLAPQILVASWGDFGSARKVGYQRFALTQHGAGQSYSGARTPDYPSYPGGRSHQGVGLFLVPNEHAAGRWRKAYPRAAVRVVGCPKLDTLPARGPGPGPVVAVSFHWDFQLCPETKSAFPEYRGILPELAKRWKVLGHGHPRRYDLRRWYATKGIEHVPAFTDICRRADVYVCDNSSSMFEFAATGRPVVVLNTRGYRRGVEHGLRFWSAANVGVQCDEARDLVAAIERALEQRPEDVAAREAALDVVYQPRHGAAALAAAALREWAVTTQPAARVVPVNRERHFRLQPARPVRR